MFLVHISVCIIPTKPDQTGANRTKPDQKHFGRGGMALPTCRTIAERRGSPSLQLQIASRKSKIPHPVSAPFHAFPRLSMAIHVANPRFAEGYGRLRKDNFIDP